jgi:periplasmic divalent cation tolerance protein
VEPLADVTVTAADAHWLAGLTRSLVTQGLVACGNVLPSVRSLYAWQGNVEDESEALVILHTRASLVPRVIEAVEAEHPYETPQVIAIPILATSPAYHRWVIESTHNP